MEFKVTPGKWFACCLETMPHFVFDEIGETVICKSVHNQEMRVSMPTKEYRANALLISKAPELLNLHFQELSILKDIFNELPIGSLGITLNCIIKDKEKLIKEATEL